MAANLPMREDRLREKEMSDPHLQSIEDLLDNGDVPPRVTNRAIFRGLQAIWNKLSDNTDCLANIADRLDIVERRVDTLEVRQKESPSLFAYVKEKPRAAAMWLIGILFFMTLALSFSEPLRTWVSALIP